MVANQNLNVNLRATKETNIPLIVSYLNLVLSNSIMPTLYYDYQQCPYPVNFTISLPPNIRRYQKLEY